MNLISSDKNYYQLGGITMRKLAFVLPSIMIIISILACGGTAEVTQETIEQEVGQVETIVETSIDVKEEESVATPEPAIPTEPAIESPAAIEIEVQEQIIFDESGIKITVKSLDMNGSFFGPELKVLIENDSEINITVQVRKVSINDVMVDTIFSSDVTSGKKINDEITFMSSSLSDAEIHTIKDIEFLIHIFDADSWDTIIDSNMIQITTSADDAFIQEYDDRGFVVVDSNDIKIVIQGLETEDSFWGADVLVYLENNTEQDLTFQVRDVSINGFMVSPIFSCDVVAGKRAYSSITFMESNLADNDITEILELDLRFHVFDMDSWKSYFDSDIISITFD